MARILLALVGIVLAGTFGARLLASSSTAADPKPAVAKALPGTVWPAYGQAAVRIGDAPIQAGPNQHPAPIASVAKVMTAYLVLRAHPLEAGKEGPSLTLTEADVADTERRRGQLESVVSVAAGEQLTERQALEALLLPSANNIAAVLARWVAGSEAQFVARMNATARTLGMRNTRYTDPSGYDDATVSTAADQVLLVERAMRLPVFASIVATPIATLPVAGVVHNTDTLLGSDVTGSEGRYRIDGLSADDEELDVRVNGRAVHYETGWVACNMKVVPSWGDACSHGQGRQDPILIQHL